MPAILVKGYRFVEHIFIVCFFLVCCCCCGDDDVSGRCRHGETHSFPMQLINDRLEFSHFSFLFLPHSFRSICHLFAWYWQLQWMQSVADTAHEHAIARSALAMRTQLWLLPFILFYNSQHFATLHARKWWLFTSCNFQFDMSKWPALWSMAIIHCCWRIQLN